MEKREERAKEGGKEARQSGQSRVHMISAADWRAAGGGGTDCDPKDVARMVEDYVIEKKGGRFITANHHIHYFTPHSSANMSFFIIKVAKKGIMIDAYATKRRVTKNSLSIYVWALSWDISRM